MRQLLAWLPAKLMPVTCSAWLASQSCKPAVIAWALSPVIVARMLVAAAAAAALHQVRLTSAQVLNSSDASMCRNISGNSSGGSGELLLLVGCCWACKPSGGVVSGIIQ